MTAGRINQAIAVSVTAGLLACGHAPEAQEKGPSAMQKSGSALAESVGDMPVFKPNARILFQGDSITDGNRGRNEDPNHILDLGRRTPDIFRPPAHG